MKKRIGVIAIVVEERDKVSNQLNDMISEFGNIVLGRMGVPSREHGLSVISLIVEGTSDDIGALTGKLGNLPGITVKSALTSRYLD
ncbi:TM1266 family iron-only hydrogenase system putative regulator [Natronospora cellulosivora (SeqCode)]